MTLSQLERDTYIKKLGGDQPATKKLSEIKKEYQTSQVGGGTTQQVNLAFLRKLIVDNGGTPSSNFESDLLKQALVSKGITPTNCFNQNKKLLLINL